ncbi:MAG: hypothetical protein LUQ13_05095 [Methanomicrobiales archaeon]|nr:hypothetical protein [Methanomicrobiales archaeon]
MNDILRLSVLPMLVVLIIVAAGCVGQPPGGTPTPTTLQPTQTITPVPTETPVPTPVPTASTGTTVPTTIPATTVPPVPAQITITSPQDGQTFVAGDIVVVTSVKNFAVVDKQGQANVAGEGHVHFYMDVNPVPTDPQKPAIPANATTVWAHVSGTAYTFTNVPQGKHIFTVQLVNNDHTPVIPLATDNITVTFVGTTPTPVPTTLGGGGGY